MWSNPQETADLVAFAEEILNVKLHFLSSVALLSLQLTLNKFNIVQYSHALHLRRLIRHSAKFFL